MHTTGPRLYIAWRMSVIGVDIVFDDAMIKAMFHVLYQSHGLRSRSDAWQTRRSS